MPTPAPGTMPPATALSREAILQRADVRHLPREEVSFLGGSVLVRVMTAGELDAFQVAALKAERAGKPNLRANLIARTVCDAQGKRVFSDDDAERLADLPGPDLDAVFAVAQRLNRLDDASARAAEKN